MFGIHEEIQGLRSGEFPINIRISTLVGVGMRAEFP
jgi:hypothetical protein